MTSPITEQRETLKEITGASMAFLREARNGVANIEQARVGAQFAHRATSAIGMDLKHRLAAPRLAEIESGFVGEQTGQ